MATAMASIKSTSNARSVSFVGLTIAIMAVSAWVTVPLGPVPFTLQMFAIVFAVAVLKPREAIAAMAGYLILGAVGLPVFSGMRGGLGILAGPTGGFLWGSFFGVAVAAPLLHALRSCFDQTSLCAFTVSSMWYCTADMIRAAAYEVTIVTPINSSP